MPFHLILFSDGREYSAQAVHIKGQRVGTNFVTHEEPTGQVVRMVVGFSDPAIMSCQQVTDLGHNPHAVGAGDYQSKGAHQINSTGSGYSSKAAYSTPGQGKFQPVRRFNSKKVGTYDLCVFQIIQRCLNDVP